MSGHFSSWNSCQKLSIELDPCSPIVVDAPMMMMMMFAVEHVDIRRNHRWHLHPGNWNRTTYESLRLYSIECDEKRRPHCSFWFTIPLNITSERKQSRHTDFWEVENSWLSRNIWQLSGRIRTSYFIQENNKCQIYGARFTRKNFVLMNGKCFFKPNFFYWIVPQVSAKQFTPLSSVLWQTHSLSWIESLSFTASCSSSESVCPVQVVPPRIFPRVPRIFPGIPRIIPRIPGIIPIGAAPAAVQASSPQYDACRWHARPEWGFIQHWGDRQEVKGDSDTGGRLNRLKNRLSRVSNGHIFELEF